MSQPRLCERQLPFLVRGGLPWCKTAFNYKVYQVWLHDVVTQTTEVLITIAKGLNNINAVITYKEISDFIEKEFKIRPKFTTVDEKTLEVSYKPGVYMPTISVRSHIEAMRKDIVCLSYECGTPASLMIAGVVAYLEEKITCGIEVNTTDKRINIYPQRFKQIEKVMEYVALSNITFEENTVNVGLSMV